MSCFRFVAGGAALSCSLALPSCWTRGTSSSTDRRHAEVVVAASGPQPIASPPPPADPPRWTWPFGDPNTPKAPEYELDPRDRSPPARDPKKPPACDTSDLVEYRGLVLRYDAPVRVHPAFVERLIRFERVVREVALEVYGRAPRLLHHGGAFSCRTTATGRRWSEHAFGNALDVEGFSFEPLGRAASSRSDIEPARRPAFRVRVGPAWASEGRSIDKRFFSTLIERLRARRDVFRGIIGPPDPAHTTHLHLDVGPWSYARVMLPFGS